MLKYYIWIQILLGLAAVVVGLLLGGPILPAVGVCSVALAAQCAVHADRHQWAAILLGLISILLLFASSVVSFLYMTSQTAYADSVSPLSALFALAVYLLIQCFLILPVEDRNDLDLLRRGITRMIAFAGIGFVGIVLTYVLSYFLYDAALAALELGETVQDFHYLEGVLALAMAFTSARAVFRGFWGREKMKASQEDRNEAA